MGLPSQRRRNKMIKEKLKRIYDFLPSTEFKKDVPIVRYLKHFLIIKRTEFVSSTIAPLPYLRVQNKNKAFCLTLYGNTVTNGSSVVKKNKHINLILDHILNQLGAVVCN
jgi:hypothetical protein